MTIQEAIDKIIAAVPGAPFPETVDTVKIGDTSQDLKGIAVTFLANSEVIQGGTRAGANLIIAHEPLFYNHLDQTDWLAEDPVYHAKRKLLEDNHIVVWRFHDYLHSIRPDNTIVGLIEALDLQMTAGQEDFFLCRLRPMSLLELGQYVKQRLGISNVRIVGDLAQVCEKVAVSPGSPPIQYQVAPLREADVLIAGEIDEWAANEYVRDATRLGFQKGMIVIGHAASEEPGMKRMVPWLEGLLPGVPIQFIPTRNAFYQL